MHCWDREAGVNPKSTIRSLFSFEQTFYYGSNPIVRRVPSHTRPDRQARHGGTSKHPARKDRRWYGSMTVFGAQKYTKRYVEVIALHRIDGFVVPICILWDDGRRFELRLISDGKRTKCEKTRGWAIRYLVMIGKHQRELFRDDHGWFVECVDETPVAAGWDPRYSDIPC